MSKIELPKSIEKVDAGDSPVAEENPLSSMAECSSSGEEETKEELKHEAQAVETEEESPIHEPSEEAEAERAVEEEEQEVDSPDLEKKEEDSGTEEEKFELVEAIVINHDYIRTDSIAEEESVNAPGATEIVPSSPAKKDKEEPTSNSD